MIPVPGRIRVLVVDDSLVIRRLVTEALASDPQIEVVGIAQNGRVAVERVKELHPDAVTMDIEMPVMNGIDAVRALRRTHPRLPVVMFSTLTERGASATLDALAAGASDYVTKPSNVGSFSESQQNIRDQLIPKLKALTGTRRIVGVQAPIPAPTLRPRRRRTGSFGVLAIGSSTGGPDALGRVLPALPVDLAVPVVVVQHMPPLFTRLLAQRLGQHSRAKVVEACEGEPLVPGKVVIAPGGQHLTVRRQGTGVLAHLTDDPPENFCRPAVDVLFRSVASVFGDRVLALVLTGMGRDGASGAKAIRDAGGEVFVQDEATSVVWGMPGAVAMSGQADRVLALERIGPDVAAALSRDSASVGVTL
jgi:two-component system chemotaxis response regulator CheB